MGYGSVMRLRNQLDELGKMEGVSTTEKGQSFTNTAVWDDMMVCTDPEEFLNILFKHTLDVDPFIQIKYI